MKLKAKKGQLDIELLARTEKIYERMFKRWYSGNDELFQISTVIRSDNYTNDIIDIKENLLKGMDVRSGYTRSAIKGVRNYFIFIINPRK